MAIITAGYDGTVDETQFAELLHRYSVVGPEDFKATTQAGDRIVAISDGVALGPGTRDVATSIPNIQFTSASGTRWDLVVLRRDWQPPGGASSVYIVEGGSTKAYPVIGTAATNWNRRPGIVDDQPLYLQEVNGTLLGQRIDLRCWAANGGLFAKDDLARTYLDRVGTEVSINGAMWQLQVGANDVVGWVKTGDITHNTGIVTLAPLPEHLFTAITDDEWGGIKYAVRNGIVSLNGAVSRGSAWGHNQTIARIPAGLRPTFRIQGMGCQVIPSTGDIRLPAGGIAASFSASWPLY